MTIRDLIAKLETAPPDADVVVYDDRTGEYAAVERCSEYVLNAERVVLTINLPVP